MVDGRKVNVSRRGQGAGRVTWIASAMLPPLRLAVAQVAGILLMIS
jgi:hypothetical protein